MAFVSRHQLRTLQYPVLQRVQAAVEQGVADRTRFQFRIQDVIVVPRQHLQGGWRRAVRASLVEKQLVEAVGVPQQGIDGKPAEVVLLI